MFDNYKKIFKLDETLFADVNKEKYIELYNCFLNTNEITYLNQLTKLIDDQNEYKLKELQNKLKINHGNFNEEYAEQLMSMIFINSSSKVLEIGGNIGRNSMIIASIVNNDNYLVLETDKSSVAKLEENKIINNFNFKIEPSALSARKLIQCGWDAKPSDIVLEGFFSVDIISYSNLQEKYPIDFDTLVLDCEGAFYYILEDFPEILDNINLILIENDYYNQEHEIKMREILTNNNFKLVYCKEITGCWNDKQNFYEVYKKF
jgi:FkbM family methyltransferase